MGKHLQRNDSIAGGNYQGCMCGILHILDYHHWQSVKSLLPHKKHGGKRRRFRWNESPKPNLRNRDLGEEFMDADAEPLLVNKDNVNSVPTSRRSGKRNVKSPRAKEREENHRSWILSLPLRSWLHRTNTVDNLEPSEDYLGHIGNDETDPVIIPQKSGKMDAVDHPSRDVSDQELDGCADVLEMFKVNREFFLKILQDPDACKNQFHGLKNSNIKVRLTKSRSFPLANSSQVRNIRPSTLKHKQNEVWLFLDREQSKFQKDHYANSVTAEGDTSGSADDHGWNQVVVNRFSDIKQKINHALKESKMENGGRTSIDGGDIFERLEITIGQDGKKNNGSDEDLRKRRLQHVRRTSSLNESLDRYAKLFENSFGKETKYSHSRSLRVTSEEKALCRAQKSGRRNLSLPDLDFLASLSTGTSRGSFRLEMATKTVVDRSTNENGDNQNTEPELSRTAADIDGDSEPLDAITEARLQTSIVERSDSIENIEHSADLAVDENEKGVPGADHDILEEENELAKKESSVCREEICVTKDPGLELSQNQGFFIETFLPDHIADGLELDPTSPQNRITKSLNRDKAKDDHRSLQVRSGHYFQADITENADFSYVRDVLELSGFIDCEEPSRIWHSLDQPLSPSVFKVLEDLSHHENEISENICCNHQLLFDLVNETLGEMNEKSYTYFPKAFSLDCNVRPMPKGDRLLKEVWTWTSKYLSLRPELDKSLDDVVARDLAKKDGWMDLEWEMEMVALEIEDLIFDQLLDEFSSS